MLRLNDGILVVGLDLQIRAREVRRDERPVWMIIRRVCICVYLSASASRSMIR